MCAPNATVIVSMRYAGASDAGIRRCGGAPSRTLRNPASCERAVGPETRARGKRDRHEGSLVLDTAPFSARAKKCMRTSDGMPRYDRTTFVISVPLFLAAVFLGLPSIACRTSQRDRLCEVRTMAVISIHFAGIWMLGAESEGDEQRESERNPIISLAGCHVGAAVTRQVFSFITYESGRPSSFQPDRGIKQDFTDEAR